MNYGPWITAEECWVVDILKFYYDVYGHPSPDFRCFNPTIHYFMRDVEDIMKKRGVFSCCFMGRGMIDFIAHQPPTWHMLKFHDSEPWPMLVLPVTLRKLCVTHMNPTIANVANT